MMIKIPTHPKELLDKTAMVVRYFVFDKAPVSKFRMHKAVLQTLSPFRKQKLIFFRTTVLYILPYLSKSFGVSLKQSILIDHYMFLKKKFSLTQLHQLFNGNGLEVYAEINGDDKYSVLLKPVTSHLEFEGSMSLIFKQNDITLYSLSFTFIRGAVFNIGDPYIVYVTALQGAKNEYDRIRTSTKNFKENSLPVILFKALEAITLALSIEKCLGISARNHVSLKNNEQFERFYNNYDAFWINNGGVLAKDDYLLSFPLVQKPIEQIQQSHRNRTVKKRQKMHEMAAGVTRAMNRFLQQSSFKGLEIYPLPVSGNLAASAQNA